GSRCRPEPQRVDRLSAITDYRPIVGDTEHSRRIPSDNAECTSIWHERAGDLHFHGFVRPCNLPGICTPQPVITLFVLPAVLYGLFKDSVLVSQAISHCGKLQSCHRVEETRGEPTKSSIPQTGIGLLF